MRDFKPFILVLHDNDESALVHPLTRALKDDFSIFFVTSSSSAKTLLQSIVPDCIILDLSSAEAVPTRECIRSLNFKPPVLAFVSSQFLTQVAPEIELHPSEALTDPSALRDIVETASKRPHRNSQFDYDICNS